MMPIVDGLEAEFEGQVVVYRLNAITLDNARLQTEYGIRGHPSFVVLDGNGRSVERFWGIVEVERLREAMEQVARP
jgi:thioredoxin-like negative regulator of GroEL